MALNHKSFSPFYPSGYFPGIFPKGFSCKTAKGKEINLSELMDKEISCRDINNAAELEAIYKKALQKGKCDGISGRIKTAKAILKNAQDEMNHFTEKTLSHYQHLMTFFGIMLSITSAGFGSAVLFIEDMPQTAKTVFLAFLIFMIAGALIMYLLSANIKNANVRINELFRNSFICFELFGSAAQVVGQDDESAEESNIGQKRK